MLLSAFMVLCLLSMSPAPLAKKKAPKPPPYDAPWLGFYTSKGTKVRVMDFPEVWVSKMPQLDPDSLEIDADSEKAIRKALAAARKKFMVKPGDKRLPAALKGLKTLTAVTTKGPQQLTIKAFLSEPPVLNIFTERPKKAGKAGVVYIPPRNKTYKGGPLRLAGKGRTPSKAQLAALKASLVAHAKAWAEKCAGDNDDAECQGEVPAYLDSGPVAKKLTRKKVRLFPIKSGKRAAYLATLRYGRYAAGTVLLDSAGRSTLVLSSVKPPSEDIDQPGMSILGLVDTDGDGYDEVLHSSWNRDWDATGMWRVVKGKVTVHNFYGDSQ